MLKASIDIGSNTTLLLIAEIKNGQIFTVEDHSVVTALGKDLDKNKVFIESSMADTFKALSDYKEIITRHKLSAEQTIITATEASRVALNAPAFYQKIKEELGFSVKIISSDEEATYTAIGVSQMAKKTGENLLSVLDIGGASTEIIKLSVEPFQKLSSISLPLGSVRATDWLQNDRYKDELAKILSGRELKSYQTDKLVCVAGSMTSIGAMIKGLSSFEADLVNGIQLSMGEFNQFVDNLQKYSGIDLETKYPFLGKRARTIYAGALIARDIALELKVKSLSISTAGLRHGTILIGGGDV